MEKLTKDKRIRLVLIAICVIVFILLILYIIHLVTTKNSGSKNSVDAEEKLRGLQIKSGTVKRSTHSIGIQKCTSNGVVCLHDIVITYDAIGTTNDGKNLYRGNISYYIENKSNEDVRESIRLIIGGYKIPLYGAIGANTQTNRKIHFDKYIFDFANLNTYTIEYGGESENQVLYDNFMNDPDALSHLDVNY